MESSSCPTTPKTGPRRTLRRIRQQQLQSALGGESPTASPRKKKSKTTVRSSKKQKSTQAVRARRVLMKAKNADATSLNRLGYAMNNGKDSDYMMDDENQPGSSSGKTVSATVHAGSVIDENDPDMIQNGQLEDFDSDEDQDGHMDLENEENDDDVQLENYQHSSRESTPDLARRIEDAPIQPELNAIAQDPIQNPSPPPIQPAAGEMEQIQDPPPLPIRPEAREIVGGQDPPPLIIQLAGGAIGRERLHIPPPPPNQPQVAALVQNRAQMPPPPPPPPPPPIASGANRILRNNGQQQREPHLVPVVIENMNRGNGVQQHPQGRLQNCNDGDDDDNDDNNDGERDVLVDRRRGDVLRMYQHVREYYLNDPAGIADKERRGKVSQTNPLMTYVGEGIYMPSLTYTAALTGDPKCCFTTMLHATINEEDLENRAMKIYPYMLVNRPNLIQFEPHLMRLFISIFDDYILSKGFPDGIATKWRLSVPDRLTNAIQNAAKTMNRRRRLGVIARQVDENNRPLLPHYR
ncbi:hypothetical protein QAD02_020994 [Eretmocerus hayati]|uniref:Uncharacterized protein n=1 Tax=Eretmocerus hayati TaxID=131215 RepID=A0ACC2PQB5_9HYME|nr:hypothetical protein QAD02_020994 [Eretmocerus hayati]